MDYQAIFKRYELKYIITSEQRKRLLEIMREYTEADRYPLSTVRNIYFDTDSFRLIRRSIDSPKYKEKLRLRSYSRIEDNGRVFVEIKKKYNGVVYKRRLAMPERDAMEWICSTSSRCGTQIEREISYFKDFYAPLHPKVFLSYDREAYYSVLDNGVRITFDSNILARCDRLSLSCDVGGQALLESGLYLMEIKSPSAIPLWLTHALSREKIYKTPFSKYGTAYRKYIFNELKENNNYGLTVSRNF